MKDHFCLSRHLLPAITLYPTQQNWKCLHIRNRQYTEFHISKFEVVGPLGQNLNFFNPLGFDVQTNSDNKTQKIKLYQPIRKALRTPKFVLSEAIYLRTKKKLRGAGQVQVRGAQLRRKRFLPENTCFVDPEILWSYSALMWKQTGHKH